ncbi:MAG: response regulator, partial [Deltaproteobacteria bacterium]|nr:response regulator [Deltaproteobacteria bacterium]
MKKQKTVLIADDDKNLVGILKDRLTYEGYKVCMAYEGQMTIETTYKKKPDLILLDLWMPDGTGHTVLQELRGNEETREIPIIV